MRRVALERNGHSAAAAEINRNRGRKMPVATSGLSEMKARRRQTVGKKEMARNRVRTKVRLGRQVAHLAWRPR